VSDIDHPAHFHIAFNVTTAIMAAYSSTESDLAALPTGTAHSALR
jgi:hypothetical protein